MSYGSFRKRVDFSNLERRPDRMPVCSAGIEEESRGRESGLYAPYPPAIPIAPLQALAFGHLVPTRPEDRGRLAHHPKEQGALLGPFEQPCCCRTRIPELTEGRPEGEAEKVGCAKDGGKSQGGRTAADSLARTAVSERSGRVHEGPPAGPECPSTGRGQNTSAAPRKRQNGCGFTLHRPPAIPIAPLQRPVT
jgi:hypothetical protein